MSSTTPNILWLVSEDCPPRGQFYGDLLIPTPNIDRLVSRGVLFENAFSTYPVCAPSRFSLITGMEPASSGPAHHMRAIANIKDDFQTYAEIFRDAGYFCTNNSKTDYNCDLESSAIWDDSSEQAHWRNRVPGQPFLAVFNLDVTHESAIFSEEITSVHPEDVLVPSYLPDTPEIRADLARHYTAVEKMDAQFGRIIAQLHEDGLSEDTVIIYSSDHGGISPRSKRFCYDEGLRVPLVFGIPDKFSHISKWSPGNSVSTPVSLIDITPTLLHLAGLPIPGNMHGRPLFGQAFSGLNGAAFGGRDRMDERYDFVRTVRTERFRYIRNYFPDRPNGQHIGFMFLAEGYQSWEREFIAGNLNEIQSSFWLEKPAEELYEISSDSDQTNNLAFEEEYSKTLEEMREMVNSRMIEIRDNGLIPEGHQLEGYLNSMNESLFPVEKVLELANEAIKRDPENIERFVKIVQNEPNEILRYWAAIAIRLSATDLSRVSEALLASFRSEKSDFVRLVLAEVLATKANSLEALELLIDFLDESNIVSLRLMALNSLVYVDSDSLAKYLDIFEEIASCSDPILSSAAKYLSLICQKAYRPESATFDLEKFLQNLKSQTASGGFDMEFRRK